MENIVPSWPGIHREEPGINFTSHDIDFELPDASHHAAWIIDTVEAEGYFPGRIDFIFCTDDFLLDINRRHLGHDDFTDIITFPFEEDPIVGEIYISIDRVKENAETFHVNLEDELRRVMIHGVLHLCGYDDHEEDDIEEIRRKEDEYLGNFE